MDFKASNFENRLFQLADMVKNYDNYLKKVIIIGRKIAVKIPLSPIARAPKAAAFSLISIALAVPIPCDTSPRAKPFEVSCFILISLKTIVPNKAPIIPVINTNPTAKDGIAPICCEVIIAIGAVIDFVVIDKIVGR